MWFWSHENTPKDIIDKKPEPGSWGKPYAEWPFGEYCTWQHFNQMQLRFDIYFCGWSGQDEFWNEQCYNYTNGKTCEDWVGNNPSYFIDAYWLINYMDVYQM